MHEDHDHQEHPKMVDPFAEPTPITTTSSAPASVDNLPANHNSALNDPSSSTSTKQSSPALADLLPAVGNYADPPLSYKQKTDPTLQHFLSSQQDVIGQPALAAQLAGKTPSDRQVRVKSVKSDLTTMGQGLHEITPTSERGHVAKISDPQVRQAAAQFQSGARTTPALQPLVTQGGKVTGHTGTFVLPAKPTASTHTKGQADAHDRLRDAHQQTLSKGLSGLPFVVNMLNAHLESTPHAQQVLNEEDLTGAHPNLKSIPGPLEPVSDPPGPNRRSFATAVGLPREEVKANNRGLKRSLSPTSQQTVRSPSPERKKLRSDGTGGDYVDGPSRSSAVPAFPDQNALAHAAAWATQPQRLPLSGAPLTSGTPSSASSSSSSLTDSGLPLPASASSPSSAIVED